MGKWEMESLGLDVLDGRPVRRLGDEYSGSDVGNVNQTSNPKDVG